MEILDKINNLIFTQNMVCVSKKCPLACIGCKLWQNGTDTKKEETDIAALLKENKIFEGIKYKKWFHIVGGEPLLNEDIKNILTYLKARSVKNILWTTGIFKKDSFLEIKDLIDEVYLFVPTILKIKYHNLTGYEYLKIALDNLDYLLELKKKVIIHASLKLDTIQEAPALYELTHKKKVPLLFHYAKDEGFRRESLENIWRFKRIKGVSVKEVKEYPKDFCVMYPNLHIGLKHI